jgi:hypothetical protein
LVEKHTIPLLLRLQRLQPAKADAFRHPGIAPTNLTRVETFPGAACLRRFPVMHASRQISRGLLLRAKAAPLQARRHVLFNPAAAGLSYNLSAPKCSGVNPERLRGERFAPLNQLGNSPLRRDPGHLLPLPCSLENHDGVRL